MIDADYGPGQRFVARAYLLAEVVSDADDVAVPGTDLRWIDIKRDLYRCHEHCHSVLVISQDRMRVAVDIRTEAGWHSQVLDGGSAQLSIPALGFRCYLADLYEKTPLRSRSVG